MYVPDLTTDTLEFPGAAPVLVRFVGWLHDKHPFPTGKVDRSVIRRLQQFEDASRSGWQAFESMGSHICELCHDSHSAKRLFIPGDGFTFYAPEGIVHYITDHRYAPPVEFCEAVLTSPPPESDEYFQTLTALGWGPEFLQNATRNRETFQPRHPGLWSRLTRR